jgi:hypothetical protein
MHLRDEARRPYRLKPLAFRPCTMAPASLGEQALGLNSHAARQREFRDRSREVAMRGQAGILSLAMFSVSDGNPSIPMRSSSANGSTRPDAIDWKA